MTEKGDNYCDACGDPINDTEIDWDDDLDQYCQACYTEMEDEQI